MNTALEKESKDGNSDGDESSSGANAVRNVLGSIRSGSDERVASLSGLINQLKIEKFHKKGKTVLTWHLRQTE